MQAWNGSCIRLFLNSDTKSVTVPAVSLPAVCAVESDECDNENIQLYSKKHEQIRLSEEEKRLFYPAKFTAQLIEDREKGTKLCELFEKYSRFRLDEPSTSKWMKQKDDSILKAVASEHKNVLKLRQSVKYNVLFDQLKILFDGARTKG